MSVIESTQHGSAMSAPINMTPTKLCNHPVTNPMAHQAELHAKGREAQSGGVGAQGQAELGARGQHAVRLQTTPLNTLISSPETLR